MNITILIGVAPISSFKPFHPHTQENLSGLQLYWKMPFRGHLWHGVDQIARLATRSDVLSVIDDDVHPSQSTHLLTQWQILQAYPGSSQLVMGRLQRLGEPGDKDIFVN